MAVFRLRNVLIVFVVSVLISLGFWQLHRADEKRKILSDYQQRFHQAPAEFTEKPILYQAVKIHGKNQHPSLLLDNQFYQHRFGFQVLTPVEIDKHKPWVLVNRGWVEASDRRHLPTILPLAQLTTLQGNIYFSAKKPILLKSEPQAGSIIERLDFEIIAQKIGHSVYPFVILLSPHEFDHYVRDWQPVVMSPQRHIGYAIQWFALALVFLLGSVAAIRNRAAKPGE